ncbi:MAG TPA: hypothetical protein VFW21_01550 [Mycobacterium sp.]|nr:hypothetical protein [Mycobacterium sp.]
MIGAAAVAAGLAAPVTAYADPTPDPGPPPPPNVNAFAMTSPVDYVVNDGVYAFAGPGGVTCVLSRATKGYGCSGTLPGAPGGANVVTGGAAGEPGFSVADRPLYLFDKPVKQLPANTRLSMGTVSCGVDAGGAVICSNSFDQTGFVVGPAGSYTFGAVNPLLDRPKGTNPYFN